MSSNCHLIEIFEVVTLDDSLSIDGSKENDLSANEFSVKRPNLYIQDAIFSETCTKFVCKDVGLKQAVIPIHIVGWI